MESTPNPLITTSYKSPLAKGTSYPFGAELISKVLFGIPQYNALTIGFYGNNCRSTSSSQDFLKILQIEYRKHQGRYGTCNDSFGQSYLKSNWIISVYPIFSHHRKNFRDYLDASGWYLIRTWLIEQWPNNERIGRSTLSISACLHSNEIQHVTESSIMPAKS
jgi:hypothetical protein